MPRPRKFDHDEARRLRAEGMTLIAIAERLGVSDTSVLHAVNEDLRVKANARVLENQRSKRRPCKGGCGRLVWTHTRRPDGTPHSGFCVHCIQAHEHPIQHGTESGYRRGCRCHLCRQASSAAKRRRRRNSRVPCSHGCGRLVDSINRRNPGKPPECRPCSHERVIAEQRVA